MQYYIISYDVIMHHQRARCLEIVNFNKNNMYVNYLIYMSVFMAVSLSILYCCII